jgi:hypothetical protein
VEIMTDDIRHLEHAWDFGDDGSEAPSVNDPAFDAWLRGTAPSLNAPATVPTAEMWSAIKAAQDAAVAADEGRVAGVLRFRRHRWLMPATIAATLLLGVALDRVLLAPSASRSTNVGPRNASVRDARAPGVDANARTDLYRLAAVQTLSQAEAVLTAYRAGGAGVRDDASARQLGTWAREVLGSTRLLIDSPAGADAQLRPLLNDIELVLVQIVRLSGTPLDSADRALIDHAMREHDLLPRIRTAVPAGTTDAAIASDD